MAGVAPHAYQLAATPGSTALAAVVAFSPGARPAAVPDFDEAAASTRSHWNRFWSTGGAIDLSGSTDPRWRELERRIVLSQYLTAIQCAGRFPPQETGLTFNSWEGKFHLEMHWWHAAQFALWDRLPLLERSLGYYDAILPKARATAARQGYAGARWPKMTEPDRRRVAVERRAVPRLAAAAPDLLRGTRATARSRRARRSSGSGTSSSRRPSSWRRFPAPDAGGARLVLGPPAPVRAGDLSEGPHQQLHVRAELLGVGTADRAGVARAPGPRPRDPSGTACSRGSRRLPVADGKYLFAESAPDTYSNPTWATDHPSVLAALGVLPGDGIDRAVMDRTLDVDLGQLELADDVGLGLPDGRDDRGAARQGRNWPSTRCCSTRRRTGTARTATTTSGPA